MISVFIGVLANILRAYSIYRFMELLYMPKDKADKRLPYLAFVLLTSGGYYLFHQQMINIVTNLAGLFWIASAYYGSLRKNILLVFSIYSVNAVVECLVFFVSDFRRYTQIRESVNECITSILILSIVILLERTKAVKNKKFHLSLPLFAGAVSIPVGSVFTVMLLLQGVLKENWLLEVIIMDILAVNIIFFYLYGAIQDYYQQKTEKEIFLTKMKIYSRQLDIQKNSMDRIREIRHDMKHHIEELKYLARRKDTEKLMAYLTEMQRHMVNEEELVSSGNYNIDGTLNYFLHMAKEKLNRVEIQVTIPENLEIHNYIFNVILGNLLENAIDAALHSKEKYLKVRMRLKQGMLHIRIDNSFDGNVKMKHQKLVTTKADREQHGLGLESVSRIVSEMDGLFTVTWQGTMFSASVTLYLETLG